MKRDFTDVLEIKIEGVPLIVWVQAEYYAGIPATADDPGEDSGWEVQTLKVSVDCDSVMRFESSPCILPLLSDALQEKIREEVIEVLSSI